ncbi:DUF7344 domain-containing protein [Natronomonas aquatica]|uniref:DUF7344 domain-containing protein n=1 Tax=Natronomonas aquatica TaxID=2841590 RepID=UPI003AF12989
MMTATTRNSWDSHNSIPLSIDESITAIQNSRRRLVLLFLDELETPIGVDELAEAITVLETGKKRYELGAQDRKSVYVALIQVHLDTLDDLGAVVYDDQSKRVWPTGATAPLVSIIRYLQSVCDADS